MKLLKTNKNITLNTIEKNLIFDLINIEIKKCIPFIEDEYKNKLIKIKNKMKLSWYNGTTGLDPLDFSIKNAQKYGWTHHIERLMILSNIMNMCEIHPQQVYKWFIINILNFDIEQDFIYNEFETIHKNKFNQFYKEIIKGL